MKGSKKSDPILKGARPDPTYLKHFKFTYNQVNSDTHSLKSDIYTSQITFNFYRPFSDLNVKIYIALHLELLKFLCK